MSRALLVIDVQNDFCEGGSLAVAGGRAVAAAITDRLLGADSYDLVVATRDHHIDPGDHFAAEPDFRTRWPRHCVVGTEGVQLHPALDRSRLEAIFDKGEYAAAYSGFEAVHDGVALAAWLAQRGVTEVDIVGIATDYCVRATALDAVQNGFATTVLLDFTAGVAAESTAAAVAEFRAAGITVEGDARVG